MRGSFHLHMAKRKPAPAKIIIWRAHELAFAKSFGIICGLYLLTVGLIATYIGPGRGLVENLGMVYYGYEPTLTGSFIGALWGAAGGFIVGYLASWLYNKFAQEGKVYPYFPKM